MLSCGLWCLCGIKTVMCILPLICLNWTSVPFLSLSMAQCVTHTHTRIHAHTHTHTPTHTHTHTHRMNGCLCIWEITSLFCVISAATVCIISYVYVMTCIHLCVRVVYAKCCLFLTVTLSHKQACGLPQGVVAMLWRKSLSWTALMHPLNVCMQLSPSYNTDLLPLFWFVYYFNLIVAWLSRACEQQWQTLINKIHVNYALVTGALNVLMFNINEPLGVISIYNPNYRTLSFNMTLLQGYKCFTLKC